MPEIRMDVHLKQTMRLSPRMLQSARILQMDVQELREYVDGVLEENPILDRLPEQESQREFEGLLCSAPWLGTSTRTAYEEQHYREPGAWDAAMTSLSAFFNRSTGSHLFTAAFAGTVLLLHSNIGRERISGTGGY